jgi:hypothetical protein
MADLCWKTSLFRRKEIFKSICKSRNIGEKKEKKEKKMR